MTPKELQETLWRKGFTNAALAAEHGVKRSMVTNVINGKTASHPMRKLLASKVGLKPENIWPDKYSKGRPRKPGRFPCF